MKEWFYYASRPQVIRRSLKFAVVVGTILVLINHGEALVSGEVSVGRLWRIGLTVLVPYCVSTSASVCTMRERVKERAQEGEGRGC